jgi:hypothetical protein
MKRVRLRPASDGGWKYIPQAGGLTDDPSRAGVFPDAEAARMVESLRHFSPGWTYETLPVGGPWPFARDVAQANPTDPSDLLTVDE